MASKMTLPVLFIFLCATLTKSANNAAESITAPLPVESGDGRGAIAGQKCAEYSQYVFTLKYPSFGVPHPINISQCAVKAISSVSVTRAAWMEFPHMTAVGYNLQNGDVGWYCGGTLISESFVLTAAHCTYAREWGNATYVRLGDLNLVRSDDGATPVDHRIVERIRHPEYKPPSVYHDIALLRLETRVSFNGWIRPACLHTKPSIGTTKAIATGWGRRSWLDDEGSSDLKKITMPVIDWQTCKLKWASSLIDPKLPNGVIADWSICAGETSVDTCQGDGGGPLVIHSKPKYHCMYDVVGVTSIGKLCGAGIPSLYTRVYNYIPWIESIVWGQE